MELMPKEAGKFIAEKAKDCSILMEGITKCANVIVATIEKGELNMQDFKQNELLPLNRGLSKDDLLNWTFLVDSLNFSFWTYDGEDKFEVTHNGIKRRGYLAMVNAINRAIDEGKKIYSPKYYSQLRLEDLKEIFRSDNTSKIPLIEERLEVMTQCGNILNRDFKGTFKTVLEMAEGSAMKLISIVTDSFPSFRDVHTFEGKKVWILKRAQILAADLALAFEDVIFDDLEKLTMFADYRVPQVLCFYGAISYSDALMDKLKKQHLFASGEREEVEIRGVSIHATELIVEEARKIIQDRKIGAPINSILVDYFLWEYRLKNAKELEIIPYHRTRSIYY